MASLGDWDKLCFFFGIYRDYEKWRQELSDKRKIFNLIGLDDMFKELQDVMSYKNDPKRYLRTFDVPAYKTHLQKIHSYTKEILLPMQEGAKEARRISDMLEPIEGVDRTLQLESLYSQNPVLLPG